MFDVGFSELIVIAVVALIVIGPERLPGVARTVGHLLGRLQRYVNDVKSDISREMQIEELKKMQSDVVSQMKGMEQSVTAQLSSVETSLNESIAAGIEEKSAVPSGEGTAPAVADASPALAAVPGADKPQV